MNEKFVVKDDGLGLFFVKALDEQFPCYALIRGKKKMWNVQIRKTNSGDLKRYGGIWKTLEDAIEESVHILERI